MANFETDDEIKAWIDEHSWDEFVQAVDTRRFAGRRLENAAAYLRRAAEKNAARDAVQAAVIAERQTTAAEKSADATVDQARTARRAFVISCWALGVAVLAVIISVISLCLSK